MDEENNYIVILILTYLIFNVVNKKLEDNNELDINPLSWLFLFLSNRDGFQKVRENF